MSPKDEVPANTVGSLNVAEVWPSVLSAGLCPGHCMCNCISCRIGYHGGPYCGGHGTNCHVGC